MQRKTEEKDRKYKVGKVEHRNRKRLKRIRSQKTKINKYMFHLENSQQQQKKQRHRWN